VGSFFALMMSKYYQALDVDTNQTNPQPSQPKILQKVVIFAGITIVLIVFAVSTLSTKSNAVPTFSLGTRYKAQSAEALFQEFKLKHCRNVTNIN